ncbi:ABC transporter ATP-binding protein/permease, partial [Alphaproteobacteria bacterium]|nr:ABC transporter ATP-binding protein/permease [Alphaproteobacteria bacterium]
LSKSYTEIMSSNRNNVFAGIYKKSDEFILNLVLPIGVIAGSLIMVLGIFISVLFLVSSQILPLIILVGFLYVFLFIFTRKRLKKNSLIISDYTNSCLEILKQIFGNLRDIKINSQENDISKLFTSHNGKLKTAQANNMIYAQIPRYIVEGFLVLIIFLLILYFRSLDSLKENINVSDIIIIMFSGLKLVPLIQRMFWGISTITGRTHVLLDIFKHIKPSNKKITSSCIFTKSETFLVKFKNVSFSYLEKQSIISNFSFKMNKYNKVLIRGSSGVGKSTLLDLIVGFLEPTAGKIERSANNSKLWLQSTSFVSANSFFPNKKVGQIIHDGYKDYNQRKVLNLIKALGLKPGNLPEHEIEDFSIGEDAELLSYGQQRRLSIARALYKEPSLLIFDEATNGLDAKSESNILKYISSLENLSFIFVSHKFFEKKFFDMVLDLDVKNE